MSNQKCVSCSVEVVEPFIYCKECQFKNKSTCIGKTASNSPCKLKTIHTACIFHKNQVCTSWNQFVDKTDIDYKTKLCKSCK